MVKVVRDTTKTTQEALLELSKDIEKLAIDYPELVEGITVTYSTGNMEFTPYIVVELVPHTSTTGRIAVVKQIAERVQVLISELPKAAQRVLTLDNLICVRRRYTLKTRDLSVPNQVYYSSMDHSFYWPMTNGMFQARLSKKELDTFFKAYDTDKEVQP